MKLAVNGDGNTGVEGSVRQVIYSSGGRLALVGSGGFRFDSEISRIGDMRVLRVRRVRRSVRSSQNGANEFVFLSSRGGNGLE